MPTLRYDVFISTIYRDPKARWKVAKQAVEELGMVAIWMDRFAASEAPSVDECRRRAAEADVVVGIVTHRYGSIPDGEARSFTEIEYDAAQGKERLMFVPHEQMEVVPERDFDQPPADRHECQRRLEAFKARFEERTCRRYKDDVDLAFAISTSLREWRERYERAAAPRQSQDAPAAFVGLPAARPVLDPAMPDAAAPLPEPEGAPVGDLADAARWAQLAELIAEMLASQPDVAQYLAERLAEDGRRPDARPCAVAQAMVRGVLSRATDLALLLDHAHAEFSDRPGCAEQATVVKRLFWRLLPECNDCFVLVNDVRAALRDKRHIFSLPVVTDVGAHVVMAGADGRPIEPRYKEPRDDTAALPRAWVDQAFSFPTLDLVIDPGRKILVEAVVKAMADRLGVGGPTHQARCDALEKEFSFQLRRAAPKYSRPYYLVLGDGDLGPEADASWSTLSKSLGDDLPSLRLLRLKGPPAVQDEEWVARHVVAVLQRERESKDKR